MMDGSKLDRTLGPSGPPRQRGVFVVWQSAQALASPPEASSGERETRSVSVSTSIFVRVGIASRGRGGGGFKLV
jgi:hypothetical protein